MKVEIYGKDGCSYCEQAIMACKMFRQGFTYLKLGDDYSLEELLAKEPKVKTYPAVFIDDKFVGGFDELLEIII